MLKYFLAAGALVVAGVPAAVGLSSNASFDRDVPVRVPEQARTVAPTPSDDRTRSVDDDGTADQGPGDVGATEAEPGDDHGGDQPRDERTEAGDDRDGSGGHHAEPGDDRGGDDNADDSGSGSDSGSDSGDDRSGSNSGSGSSGGGSDDGSGHD
ncbi:MAG TPA: hypothetical protein VFE07_15820 [Marmoricola sp.]|nr:hypothetical protein [Marmoricola sp.]